MARVGIDIDGVLYPFDQEFREALIEDKRRLPEQCPPPTRWEFYEDWKMTRECFIDYCDQFTNEGKLFKYGSPYPGSASQLWRLKDAGHTIVLITNRNFGDPALMEKHTVMWLQDWVFPYDELHFVENKTTVDVDYHVDDHTDNYYAMRGRGVNSWLLNRPWNTDDLATFRVESLEEYVDYVLGCEGSPCVAACVECGNDDPREGYDECGDCQERPLTPEWVRSEVRKQMGDEVRITSSTGGQKGRKLARFDLIPQEALWRVAELYGKGAEKYDDWNWRKGYAWSLSIGALMRHLSLFLQGEDYDQETGCHHLTAVVFHSMTLLTFEVEHPEFDDRFKP